MGLDRETLGQLGILLKPLATRLANTIVRGVVQIASDDKKLQMLQLGGLFGEPIANAEHFQPYGFSSVPLEGAEHVTIFPNGDRSHPITIAVADRRYRPVRGKDGEVFVYNNTGAMIMITKDGDIKVTPAAGRAVLVDDVGGGASLPLATKADVVALANFVNTLFVGGTGSVVVPPGSVPQPVGTTVLKGK